MLTILPIVSKMMTSASLFFDGRCGLCRREIALLRRVSRGLMFVDLHQLPDTHLGPDKWQMLEVLHLQLADGRFVTGLQASVLAWSFTPVGWLFQPLLWPWVRPLAERAYQAWAKRRFSRLGYCQLAPTPKPRR